MFFKMRCSSAIHLYQNEIIVRCNNIVTAYNTRFVIHFYVIPEYIYKISKPIPCIALNAFCNL